MLNIPDYITPILKLTEGCNYRCYFCRYANHPSATNSLTAETAKCYLKKVIEYNIKHHHIVTKIIFHGGEPLLWGIEKFKLIMEFERELSDSLGIKFVNSIQTNGYLIDDDWISLFKNNHFQVGISLDGPLELNGHYGNVGNEASLQTVMHNISKLAEWNIPFGVLSVLTSKHLGKEKEFYDYWVQNNIKNIGLCYCYNPKDSEIIDANLLGTFLIRLFDLYFWGKSNLNIREFNDAIEKILNTKSGSCTNACRNKCGYFLSIGNTGDVCFCDELERGKDTIVGNLHMESMDQIVKGERYQALRRGSRVIIDKKCHQCPVYSVCGAGCRRHDISHSESNYFCKTYIGIYDHIRRTICSI